MYLEGNSHKTQTVNYFVSQGWEVINVDRKNVMLTEVKSGDPLRCADDRYKDESPLSPAFFGGAEGIAALLPITMNHKDRFKIAEDLIKKSGFVPGIHGDEHNGDILGCGFRKAWIEGQIHWLPKLSELEAVILRFRHQFHHINLKGHHTASGLFINLESDSTVIPHGKFLVNDFWYLFKLGFKLEDVLILADHSGKLILPPKDRKLYII